MSKQEELLAGLLGKIVGENEREIIKTLKQENNNIIKLDDNYREKFIEQTLLSVYNKKLPRGFFKFKCAEDPFVKKVTELTSSKDIIGLLTDKFINKVEDGTLKELLGCLKNINKKDQVASKKSEKLNTIKISSKEKNIDEYDLSSSVVGGVCELLDYIHADYKDDYLPTKIQNYIEESNQYNDREKHFFKMLINALINSKHNQTEFIKAVGYDQKKTPHMDWGIPEDFWNELYINLKNKKEEWWKANGNIKKARNSTFSCLKLLKNGKGNLQIIEKIVKQNNDYLTAKERNLFKKMLGALNKVSDEEFKSAKYYIPINVFADDGSINESYFDKIYENLNDKEKQKGKWWKTDEAKKRVNQINDKKRLEQNKNHNTILENKDDYDDEKIEKTDWVLDWGGNTLVVFGMLMKYLEMKTSYTKWQPWAIKFIEEYDKEQKYLTSKAKEFFKLLINALRPTKTTDEINNDAKEKLLSRIDKNNNLYFEKVYENLKNGVTYWWETDGAKKQMK